MTVSSIVQRLLEKGHITAEEALVLLKAKLNKPCCPVFPVAPYNPPSPYNPPFQPYVGDPLTNPSYPPSYPQIWYSNGTNSDSPVGTSGKGVLSGNLTGTLNDIYKK